MLTFVLLGVSWGTWYTRFPTLRDLLDYSLSQMSILVLVPSVGLIVGLFLASKLVLSVGERRTIVTGILLMGVTLPSATWLLLRDFDVAGFVLLFIFGTGFGLADVAANVSGSALERHSGRSKLMLLHAGFSIGGILSVIIGALAELIALNVFIHQIIALLIAVVLTLAFARFVPSSSVATTEVTAPFTGAISVIKDETPKLRVWRNPLVLLLGFIAFSDSLADGVATDWMPLAFIDIYGSSNASSVIMLSFMFAGALIMRLIGDRLVSRFGRRPVLRVTLVMLILGILLVSLSPNAWLAAPGAFLWGIGVALAFPICISAAAVDDKTAAKNVSAVSSIGYIAYVAGPVAFGIMGDHFGFRVSFSILAFIVLLAFFASSRVPDSASKLQ